MARKAQVARGRIIRSTEPFLLRLAVGEAASVHVAAESSTPVIFDNLVVARVASCKERDKPVHRHQPEAQARDGEQAMFRFVLQSS